MHVFWMWIKDRKIEEKDKHVENQNIKQFEKKSKKVQKKAMKNNFK